MGPIGSRLLAFDGAEDSRSPLADQGIPVRPITLGTLSPFTLRSGAELGFDFGGGDFFSFMGVFTILIQSQVGIDPVPTVTTSVYLRRKFTLSCEEAFMDKIMYLNVNWM